MAIRRRPRRSRPAKRSWPRTRPARRRGFIPTSPPFWSSASRHSNSCRGVFDPSSPVHRQHDGRRRLRGPRRPRPVRRHRASRARGVVGENYRAANANLNLPLLLTTAFACRLARLINAPMSPSTASARLADRNSPARIAPRPSASPRHSGRPVLHHRRRPRRDADGEHHSRPATSFCSRTRLPAGAFADPRPAVGRRYTRGGGSYRVDWSDYRETGGGPPVSIAPMRTSVSSSRYSATTGSSRSAHSYRRHRPRRVRTFRSICCRISAGATRCEAMSPGGSATATGCS